MELGDVDEIGQLREMIKRYANQPKGSNIALTMGIMVRVEKLTDIMGIRQKVIDYLKGIISEDDVNECYRWLDR